MSVEVSVVVLRAVVDVDHCTREAATEVERHPMVGAVASATEVQEGARVLATGSTHTICADSVGCTRRTLEEDVELGN